MIRTRQSVAIRLIFVRFGRIERAVPSADGFPIAVSSSEYKGSRFRTSFLPSLKPRCLIYRSPVLRATVTLNLHSPPQRVHRRRDLEIPSVITNLRVIKQTHGRKRIKSGQTPTVVRAES